jgi:hypothetical protein
MKITYFSKFEDNKYSVLEEEPIVRALRDLGHQVFQFDVVKADPQKMIEQANKSNLFLFHTGGVIADDELSLLMGLAGLTDLLNRITVPKIMWFFDRVMGPSERFVETMLSVVDYGFFNDDTWVRRHKWENASCLHEGCETRPLGQKRKDLECDIAFIGNVWGGRGEIMDALKKMYGRKFRIFSDIWGKDFDDLCQSARVIFQPKWLMNDFCWTDQIYHVLSAGGFLLHPRLHGLKEEGLEDGKHFIGYSIPEELIAEIEFFMKPENWEKMEEVKKFGRQFVIENYTWSQRLKSMFETIKEDLLKKDGKAKN